MKSCIREKKIYCGTKYLEIDIYGITESEKGRRGKKEKVSEPKQKNLNDKNARRYLTQLANTNFDEHDLHVTATYSQKNIPDSIEEAEKEVTNYLRRLSYRRKKEGLEPLKYILVTEYTTGKKSEKPVRIHHHIFINGGLDRDTVEELWSKKKSKGQKRGERIGFINADRLQPDENGVAALCNYLTKHPNGKKRWSASQNLEKPWTSKNDHKYSRRELIKLATNPPGKEYWERKYPGWTIPDDYGVQQEYNDFTGWAIYLKLRRRE